MTGRVDVECAAWLAAYYMFPRRLLADSWSDGVIILLGLNGVKVTFDCPLPGAPTRVAEPSSC